MLSSKRLETMSCSERWISSSRSSAGRTSERDFMSWIVVTLGIAPTRPETGYGYIHFEEREHARSSAMRVKAFVEKPNAEAALRYLRSGDYLWNAGMFISQATVLLDTMERAEPDLVRALQGDARLTAVLERMGATVQWSEGQVTVSGPAGGRLRGGFELDLNDMPDQAQTLAVVALFADAPVRIVNIGNLRIKETDRLAAKASELGRLGAEVEEGDEELTVHPLTRPPGSPVVLSTYGDHRMAMALAVAGARIPNVVIDEPDVVAKTYPNFFRDFLSLLGGRLA